MSFYITEKYTYFSLTPTYLPRCKYIAPSG
ncbi:hypothetical protein GGQ93_002963 [Brevundimonas aurantiaca]|uniref:Uncharacterized protein n=1 Tax=Brevundimonas aurantiaca TaxID=74316 RepID=A0A7W9FBL4_9CAUL|nr:hypothetical protein [Brevundimonas aurantiaca]